MKSNLNKKDLISTRYAGKISGYTSSYLRRLARSGEIEGVQVGRVWMVKRGSLVHFMDAQAKRKEELSLARSQAHAAEYHAKRPAPSRVVAETIKSLPPEQFGIADFFARARVASLSLGVLAFVVGSLVVQGVIAPQLAKIEIQPAAVALAESGLSIGEGLALATYEAISGLFDSTISALATLFAPKPQIIVVAPTPEQNRENKISNTESPVAISTPPVPAVIAEKPATIIAGPSYPTYVTTLNGVSVADVKQLLASERSTILATVSGMIQPVANQTVQNIQTIQMVNKIEDLTGLIVRNGDFRGGTFTGTVSGSPAISATSGSFSSLTAGDLTSGTLVATGALTSYTSATAPFFVATSTTATSTFAGGLTVGTSKLVVDSTTGNVGIGTTTPSANLVINGTTGQTADLLQLYKGTDQRALVDSGGSFRTKGRYQLLENDGTTVIQALYQESNMLYLRAGSTLNRIAVKASDITNIAVFDGASHSISIGVDYGAATTTNGLLVQGSVGIGTTSPSSALAVSGDFFLTGSTTVTGAGSGLTFTGTGNHDITALGGTLRIGSNTIIGNIEALDDTVDIGTPSVRFDKFYANEVNATTLVGTIVGGNVSAETLTINSDNASADTENAYLAFERGSISPNALLSWNAAESAKRFEFNHPLFLQDASASTTNTTLTLQSVAGQTGDLFRISSSSSATNFLTVTGAGNVGIGTAGPAYTLHVNSISGTGLAVENPSSIAVLQMLGNASSADDINFGISGGAAYGGKIRYNNSTGLMQFYTAATPRVAIDASGNVGIGTTSPVSKLSVVGESALAGGLSVGLGYAGTTAPTNGMIIQGNVGLGTMSPSVLAQITAAS